jgi:hypothetical protein
MYLNIYAMVRALMLVQAVWKRVISVLRQQNKIDKCIEELTSFLDTFYSDLEGWLELADLYSSLTL